MHYKNGREAKNGDKVVMLNPYGNPVVGILYDAVAGNDYCNGKVAPILPTDPCPNLKEVLHLDDALSTEMRGIDEMRKAGQIACSKCGMSNGFDEEGDCLCKKWRYWHITLRHSNYGTDNRVEEYGILRYADSVADAIQYAYPKCKDIEVIAVRGATQYELDHRDAFNM